MDFYQSLELLKQATPENIAQQLFSLNLAIQKATAEEVTAIYFTLNSLGEAVETRSPVYKQIYQLKLSVESRMVRLTASGGLPSEVGSLYHGFSSALGYSAKLDAVMKSKGMI